MQAMKTSMKIVFAFAMVAGCFHADATLLQEHKDVAVVDVAHSANVPQKPVPASAKVTSNGGSEAFPPGAAGVENVSPPVLPGSTGALLPVASAVASVPASPVLGGGMDKAVALGDTAALQAQLPAVLPMVGEALAGAKGSAEALLPGAPAVGLVPASPVLGGGMDEAAYKRLVALRDTAVQAQLPVVRAKVGKALAGAKGSTRALPPGASAVGSVPASPVLGGGSDVAITFGETTALQAQLPVVRAKVGKALAGAKGSAGALLPRNTAVGSVKITVLGGEGAPAVGPQSVLVRSGMDEAIMAGETDALHVQFPVVPWTLGLLASGKGRGSFLAK